MALALRPALPTDADDISTVYLASRRAFVSFAPLAHREEEVRRWVPEVLLPHTRVVVALESARLVGFVSFVQGEPEGWIEHLYLAPGFTGRGLGARLLAEGLSRLTGPVRLCTFQENHGARRFYERHGFCLVALGDGADNEEGCPDALYELRR